MDMVSIICHYKLYLWYYINIMNHSLFCYLLCCTVSAGIYAAEPAMDPLLQAKADKTELISEIFKNESALIKYECAIHIQKAIYDMVSGEATNDPVESRKAMMIDCLSGHDAIQQCDRDDISETNEENRNCISLKKSRFIDENKKLSYPELVENFNGNSDSIALFVSDIITVEPAKLSEIINNETD